LVLTAEQLVRFFAKIDRRGDDECWEWTGGRFHYGHGAFKAGGKTSGAHRFAWAIANGPIPPGMFVCHHCDNPPCVNPAHLFVGTQADNDGDRTAKGRDARGEAHGMAKLTDGDVAEIRRLYKSAGLLQREIGRLYGVDPTMVSLIVRRRNWKHVP